MKSLEPIVHTTIGDAIVEQLKLLIMRRELRPGDRLPPETELARRLGVSRASVREALKALTAMGFIERSHEGTFVQPDGRKLFVEPFSYLVALNRMTLSELFETRRALEVELAGLAAERASQDDLAKMRWELDQMTKHADDADLFVASNVAFHLAIAHAAKNRLLLKMLMAVRGVIVQAQLQGASMRQVVCQSIRDHENILSAIQKKDRDAATRWMAEHLDNVQRGFEHYVAVDFDVKED